VKEESSSINRFAAGVYRPARQGSSINKFADGVYGPEDREEYRTPDDNFDLFVEKCRMLIRQKYDNVIVLDGFPRKGKSTGGLQLARAIDPRFGLGNIAYTASEVLRLYHRLPPCSVILNDESALGLLSRSGQRDPELMALVQALSIVGIKRMTLVCCLPDIRMLDSFVKYGRARYWINVYTRGRGKVHRAWRGAKYKTSTSRLPYDEFDEVSPIGFHSLARTKFWREYERDKVERIDKWLADHELDPEGRVKVCPDCGKKGSAYNIAVHACPIRGAAAAVAAPSPRVLPSVHVMSRPTGGAQGTRTREPAPSLTCSKCGRPWGTTYDRDRHQARCPGKGRPV
jgi:hypothetical protein